MDGLSPLLRSYLETKGLDSFDVQGAEVDLTPDELNDFHVVVGLEGSLYEDLSRMPFKTVGIEWNLVRDLDGLDRERGDALLLEVQQELSTRIRELMEILRGEDAA